MTAATATAAAIRTGVLDNGLTWAVLADPRDRVVSTHVRVRAGSADDPAGRTGMAHLLEHLMFRGTPNVPDGEFDQRMEAMGVEINASTWLDFTGYTTTAPPGTLDRVLALEADRFGRLALEDAVFAAERDVVANERRQVVESNPEEVLGERLWAAALAGSPYAWPTIGWGADIAAIERDDVTAWHASRYAPARTAVIVCGCVDVDAARAAIEATFGQIAPRETVPSPERPGVRSLPTEPVSIAISDGVRAPRIVIAWPAVGRADAGFAARVAFDELLAGGESSRLVQRLVDTDRSATWVDTATYHHRGANLQEVHVSLRSGVEPARVVDAIRDEVTRLAEQGPAADELTRMRRRVETRDAFDLASTSSRADWMAESFTAFGDVTSAFALTEELATVSTDAIRAAARDVLDGPWHRGTALPAPGADA